MNTTIRVVIDGKGSISGLATVESGLRGISSQAKKTKDDVQKAVKFDFTASVPQLKNASAAVKGLGDALGIVRNVAAGGIIGAAVIRGLGAAVDEAVKLESALVGVSSVARSFGEDVDATKRAVIAYTKDGLIGATDAALAFKQILSTGTSLPDTIKLLNSLKEVAAFNRQSFYSLGEAVVATTEGIKNGNSVKADAVGVTKNLSVLDQEYAASIGKTAKALTEQEKVQARVAGFIRESAFATGDAAKLADTYSGSTSRLSTSFDRLLAQMGSFITRSGFIKGVIGEISGSFDFLARILSDDTPERKLVKLKVRLREAQEQIKTESGFYKQYAKERAAQLQKNISNQEDALFYSKLSAKQTQAEAKAILETGRVKTEENAKNMEALKARTKAIVALDKELKNAGLTELQALEKVKAARLKLVGPSDAARRLKIEQDFTKNVDKLNQQNHDKQIQRANELAKLNEKIGRDALIAAAANPFSRAVMPEGLIKEQQAKFTRNSEIGQGAGLANSIAGGAEGAKGLVTGVASLGLDAIVPGLGQAAKPLLDALSAGPEATKKMVQEFAKAIPEVVEALITAVPVLIEELANQTPIIIERLAEKAPKIITALIAAIPRIVVAQIAVFPKLAIKFIDAIIKNIPKLISEMARGVYDAIKKVLSALTGGLVGGDSGTKGSSVLGKKGSGGAAGNFATTGPTGDANINLGLNIVTLGGSGAATKFLEGFGIKFAEGGSPVSKIARGGQPFQDSIPARLQSGELVVDRSTTNLLKERLQDGGFGGGSNRTDEMLAQILGLLSQPQVIESNVQLNNQTFAKIILGLNRTNQRLA